MQYLSSRSEYSKLPGSLVFFEHEVRAVADCTDRGVFALQGPCMYQLAGPNSVDIQSSLDIGLCQFTPIVLYTSTTLSPMTSYSEVLYGFKISRSPFETIIGSSSD